MRLAVGCRVHEGCCLKCTIRSVVPFDPRVEPGVVEVLFRFKGSTWAQCWQQEADTSEPAHERTHCGR
jgi:hypothetical protein